MWVSGCYAYSGGQTACCHFLHDGHPAIHLIGAGHLHEAEQLVQQALLQEIPSGDSQLPWVGG